MVINLLAVSDQDHGTDVIELTKDDLGPFGEKYTNEDLKKWLRGVWSFTLGYGFKVHYPQGIEVSNQCFEWDGTQRFSFEERGNIIVRLYMQRKVCNEQITALKDEDDLFWLSIMSFFLALLHALSTAHYFHVVSKHLNRLQAAYEKKMKKEEAMKNKNF